MEKVFRIKKRKEFLRVANEGIKVVTPTIILQAAQNLYGEDKNQFEIGFTATKKIGNAVIRNKTKRRMRAAVRELISNFLPTTNYVLIGRHNTASCDFAELKKNLLSAIQKANAQLGSN